MSARRADEPLARLTSWSWFSACAKASCSGSPGLVDLDGAQLYVGEQVARRRSALRAGAQDGNLEGTVAAPGFVHGGAEVRRQQQEADRDEAGEAWSDTGLVFTTHYGTPFEPRNFNRSFDRRIRKCRSKITVHGARKTCGSLLAALDVHPRVAMQILWHSKIAVTMEIYTEIPSAATREALRKRRAACSANESRCCTSLLHQQDQKRPVP